MNDDNFTYDLNATRVRVSNDAMIASLQEYYGKVGRPFTTNEYDAWDGKICGSQAISRRFGSWRKALIEIGINRGVQAHTYTVEELLDNLDMIWRELGYPPGKRKMSERGYGISERPYINRWGSLKVACLKLKEYKEGKISEEELFNLAGPERRRRLISYKSRYEILTRDKYRCLKCGKSASDGIRLEVDHKIPFSKGGSDTIDNLQTICHVCNSGKSNRFADEDAAQQGDAPKRFAHGDL